MSVVKNLIKKLIGTPPPSPSAVEDEEFNRLEFYKENYYKELERRNSLTSEVALQGTVMIALISGIFWLLQSFVTSMPYSADLFKLSVFIELILITCTGYHLFDSYYKFSKKGRPSAFLPKLEDIDKYYDECKGKADQPAFESYLKRTFIRLSDTQFINNNDKTVGLTKASKWMTRSFGCAGVVVFIFFINFTANPYYIDYQKKLKHERSKRTTKSSTIRKPASGTSERTPSDSIDRKKRENRDTNKTGAGDHIHKG